MASGGTKDRNSKTRRRKNVKIHDNVDLELVFRIWVQVRDGDSFFEILPRELNMNTKKIFDNL
jgi:hypothetical protein